MPAVNQFMEYAFQAIGFKGIEDHHVTTPRQVFDLVRRNTDHWSVRRRSLPRGAPFGLALYHAFRLEKIA